MARKTPIFAKLGGKSRRYLDTTTGQEISRRQYEKRRRAFTKVPGTHRYKNEVTGVTISERQRRAITPKPRILSPDQQARREELQASYSQLVRDYQVVMRKRGYHLTLREIMTDPIFMRAIRLKKSRSFDKKLEALKILGAAYRADFEKEIYETDVTYAGDADIMEA